MRFMSAHYSGDKEPCILIVVRRVDVCHRAVVARVQTSMFNGARRGRQASVAGRSISDPAKCISTYLTDLLNVIITMNSNTVRRDILENFIQQSQYLNCYTVRVVSNPLFAS